MTEEMPVAPLRGWTERLAAASVTPVWCVDTACVAPMRLTDRTFEFRRATATAREARIARPWPEVEAPGPPFLPDGLPFTPLDLSAAAIPELVTASVIDHGVGPVPHTRGCLGAGYKRWRSFLDRHLASYARARNDPLRPTAVSRLAVPGMNAIATHLAAHLAVRSAVRVAALQRRGVGWRLLDDAGNELGAWDAVVVATPAPQAVPLLSAAPMLAERAAQAVIEPCWAALIGLEAPIGRDFTTARPADGPLGWIARNSSKPGRRGGEAWVLHARHDWSAAHLEAQPEEVARRLLEAFATLLGRSTLPAAHLSAHRWRYELASAPIGEPCLFDAALGIAACSDWCLGGRVEASVPVGPRRGQPPARRRWFGGARRVAGASRAKRQR